MQVLHLSGLVSIFYPEVSSPNWLHLNCLRVERSIIVLDNKYEKNKNMLLSLLGAIFWFNWRSCRRHFHIFRKTKWWQSICIFSTMQRHIYSQFSSSYLFAQMLHLNRKERLLLLEPPNLFYCFYWKVIQGCHASSNLPKYPQIRSFSSNLL